MIQLGLTRLIATPVARVVFSVAGFLKQRNLCMCDYPDRAAAAGLHLTTREGIYALHGKRSEAAASDRATRLLHPQCVINGLAAAEAVLY